MAKNQAAGTDGRTRSTNVPLLPGGADNRVVQRPATTHRTAAYTRAAAPTAIPDDSHSAVTL